MPLNSKHTEASFSTNLTDSLYLQLVQVPRSADSAIFVSMTMITMTTTIEPITLTLAHAHRVIKAGHGLHMEYT